MLIKALCRQEPNERLGYQKGGINDIRKHKWFAGFDWDTFATQKLPAPILPEVADPMGWGFQGFVFLLEYFGTLLDRKT